MKVRFLRQSFVILTLLGLCVMPSQAQSTANLRGAGVITGRVLIGEKPAANVLVGVVRSETGLPSTGGVIAKNTTDAEGRYRLEQVPAGNFRVTPLAPGYVVAGDNATFNEQGKRAQLSEGETVEGLDFKLTRGGVITGKVTDTSGKPLIDQRLSVMKLEAGGRKSQWNPAGNYLMLNTDDRGVYRLYGLPEGNYLISAGTGGRGTPSVGVRGQTYQRTFYPDATDENQAKPVEVSPGFETKDIDLRLLPETVKGQSVAVRVVDGESGAPMPGMSIYFGTYQGGRLDAYYATTADSQGVARFDGLKAGRYGTQLRGDGQSEYFSEVVAVDVADSEVENIELRAQRGATITGKLVLEGVTDPSLQVRLSQVRLIVYSQPTVTAGGPPPPSMPSFSKISPDGSFRTSGLPPGKVRFSVSPAPGLAGLTFLRAELEGVPQEGIEVGTGQQVANVRLVFAYGQTNIRGQVQIVNGTLPEGARMSAVIRPENGQNYGFKGAQVDARGRFTIEGVLAGEYELTVTAMPPLTVVVGSDGRMGTASGSTPGFPRTIKQKISVPSSGEIPVNLTLDLTPKER
jgi:protocatechuate 3,4-dioxygenase beta subunit